MSGKGRGVGVREEKERGSLSVFFDSFPFSLEAEILDGSRKEFSVFTKPIQNKLNAGYRAAWHAGQSMHQLHTGRCNKFINNKQRSVNKYQKNGYCKSITLKLSSINKCLGEVIL